MVMEERMELRDDHSNVGAVVVADSGNHRKSSGFAFDFQLEKYHFDSCKERLGSLFDQVLVAFLRDNSARKCVRPIPVLCSDGRPVDLFKLFWLVWRIGGHDIVSRHNLWSFVSQECVSGFGVNGSSIKLIYMKYLSELDEWLRHMFSKGVLEDDYSGLVQKLDLLSQDMEIRFRGLLPKEQKQEEQERVVKSLKYSKDIDESINVVEKTVNGVNGFSTGQIDADNGKSCNEDRGDIVASATKTTDRVINKILNFEENITASAANDDDEIFSIEDKSDACKSAEKVVQKVSSKSFDHYIDNEDRISCPQSLNNMTPSGTDVGNVLVLRKRKRKCQSFSGMLSWLIHVAKHPNDPSVGKLPECSKWSGHENKEFWAQILLVREALLIKKHTNESAREVITKDQQKKLRMHPSMYEDDILDHQSTEKLRFSKRTTFPTKHNLCSCCNSHPSPQSKGIIHREAHMASLKAPTELVDTNVKELPSKKNNHPLFDVQTKTEISVGPLFQAEVPEWTEVPSQSDPKWLGTRMWGPEDVKNSVVRLEPMGKGRHDSCDCLYPGSVECVRFHIAEKRFKLKQELGSLFHHWRFNRMGEEVSLSWTEEEEDTFKDNMRSNAFLSNKFRKNACRILPSKTREMLLSYYLNVYLIQRRSYQNRATPKDIDSDDDEKGCGSIGGRFGYKALSIPGRGSNSILCALNQESTEFV